MIVDCSMLTFEFQDDYKDDEPTTTKDPPEDKSKDIKTESASQSELIDVTDGTATNQLELLSSTMNIIDGLTDQKSSLVDTSSGSTDLLKLMSESDFGDFVSSTPYMPSQLLLNDLENFSFDNSNSTKSSTLAESSAENVMKKKNSILQLFNKAPSNVTPLSTGDETESDKKMSPQKSKSRKDKSAWFDLFSDLDPLANPETLEKKLSENSQAA